MAKKTTPPAIMLYERDCKQIFCSDNFTREEKGLLIEMAWKLLDGEVTDEEVADLLTDRALSVAFNSIMNSLASGRAYYQKAVDRGGIGGLTRRLAEMPNWDVIKVRAEVERLRREGLNDEEIVIQLKVLYNDAKRAEQLRTPGTKQEGFINGLPANRYNGYQG